MKYCIGKGNEYREGDLFYNAIQMKQDILDTIVYDYCEETQEWVVSNKDTPGVYWQGDSKQSALQEYASALYDHVLFFQQITSDGIKTFA